MVLRPAGRRPKTSPVDALADIRRTPLAAPAAAPGSSAEGETIDTRREPRRRTVTDGEAAPWREVAAVDSERLREDEDRDGAGTGAREALSSGSGGMPLPTVPASSPSAGPGGGAVASESGGGGDSEDSELSPMSAGSVGRSATAKVSERSTQPWAHACSSCVRTSIEDPNKLATRDGMG